MPVSIVVGGQFGSEGKGKVAYHLAREQSVAAAVRVGGPNSGHTVVTDNGRFVFRQLPTAALLPGTVCVLPAGCYVNRDVLIEEIHAAHLMPDRLVIDPRAMLVRHEEAEAESAQRLNTRIGSTETGTGAAVIRRISRTASASFVTDDQSLWPYIRPASEFLRGVLQRRERVLLEGTQGFGLSVLHSPFYPFVTSRDTSAAGFLSEAGLSPLDVDEVVMVIRTYPIRVAGNSGPLSDETTWADIARGCGSARDLTELTTVTQRIRRVGRFDEAIVKSAIRINRPTRIVLNHLDYIDASAFESFRLTPRTREFARSIEERIGARIGLVGLGPRTLLSLSSPSRIAVA